MIDFHYETDFNLNNESDYSNWVSRIITSENFIEGDINYIFCDDAYLLEINKKYLNHDTLTDIITFDYSNAKTLSADIYISTERVEDNARIFEEEFFNELLRVMSHGVLHLCGFMDKSKKESSLMRLKEEEKIKLFHVEH